MTFYFILNNLDTYEEALKKLTLAEDTSNIDTAISSNELQKREQESKSRRRKKAKKIISSEDSDNSDSSSFKEKENNVPQKKILPILPQKHQFVSNENSQFPSTSKQNTKNVLCDNTFCNEINSNGKYTMLNMMYICTICDIC